jgi:hypothetical protein
LNTRPHMMTTPVIITKNTTAHNNKSIILPIPNCVEHMSIIAGFRKPVNLMGYSVLFLCNSQEKAHRSGLVHTIKVQHDINHKLVEPVCATLCHTH